MPLLQRQRQDKMGAPKINQNHPFMNREVIINLSNEMSNVLKMMAELEADFQKPFVSLDWRSPKEISVLLSLDTPNYKGTVCFHFDKKVAQKIIENMTGSAVDENSPEILDGVGEVSNMFYGAAKTKLNDIGFDLKISMPKPLWTKDLPEVIESHISMVVPLQIDGKDCFVEIIVF